MGGISAIYALLPHLLVYFLVEPVRAVIAPSPM
jgi:hypothetical protein